MYMYLMIVLLTHSFYISLDTCTVYSNGSSKCCCHTSMVSAYLRQTNPTSYVVQVHEYTAKDKTLLTLQCVKYSQKALQVLAQDRYRHRRLLFMFQSRTYSNSSYRCVLILDPGLSLLMLHTLYAMVLTR